MFEEQAKTSIEATQEAISLAPAVIDVIKKFDNKKYTVRFEKALDAIPGIRVRIGRETYGDKEHYLYIHTQEKYPSISNGANKIFGCDYMERYELLDGEYRIKADKFIEYINNRVQAAKNNIQRWQNELEHGNQRRAEFLEKKAELIELYRSFSNEYRKEHSKDFSLVLF